MNRTRTAILTLDPLLLEMTIVYNKIISSICYMFICSLKISTFNTIHDTSVVGSSSLTHNSLVSPLSSTLHDEIYLSDPSGESLHRNSTLFEWQFLGLLRVLLRSVALIVRVPEPIFPLNRSNFLLSFVFSHKDLESLPQYCTPT